MFLGIEIGGTKLQLGVGHGDGSDFVAFERRTVVVGRELIDKHHIERIGYGFGGPILGTRGVVQTSHQVRGWDNFPLVAWTQAALGAPTFLGNDCDVAALAEASFGGGRTAQSLFYVTVGTGIGGGLVIDRRIYGTDRPASAEIGHLRPGLDSISPTETVESLAAGPGIANTTQNRVAQLQHSGSDSSDLADLLARCDGHIDQLTTKMIGEAALAGNRLACDEYAAAARVLGWALAQMLTLIAPEVIIIGGGVSLVGEEVFFSPLRAALKQYAFPPLANSYLVLPAELGESVVVHGALALARYSG
jgi:glucokinase